MSRTQTITSPQSKVIRLKSKPETQPQIPAETDDTERFYFDIVQELQNQLIEADDEMFKVIQRERAKDKVIQHIDAEHDQEVKTLNDLVHDQDMKIKLLEKELADKRTKDDGRTAKKEDMQKITQKLYEMKDRRRNRNMDEGVDELAMKMLEERKNRRRNI